MRWYQRQDKDLEYNLLGGRDDNNVGTLAVAIVDDPKFGKPMPFTDWLEVSGAKNLKDFKSKTKYIGKIRSATGEQSDAISYNGRIIPVQAETMERKNQMFPTYNALSAVKYGKVNEIKNHDLSEAVGYPRGTAVVNIRGEDIWEGNKHVGRRLIIQDTKTGQAIGEEQLNDMMDGADVYMNSPGTRKTTRTGGTDVGGFV